MKKRDSLFISLPIVIGIFIAGFAYFLFWQISKFEASYLLEAKKNIAQEAELASTIITPMLEKGEFSQISEFSRTMKGHSLRLTLIDNTGKVVADTKEDSGIFDNHKDREEIKSALEGQPATAVRYSTSLSQRMIYHAMPLDCNGERYVLRSAMPTAEVGRNINMARLNMFWAILFGAEIVIFLSYYIVKKVRKPLIKLQQGVNEIASGNLDRRIDIPEDGVIRDLAMDISVMTEQLKKQLSKVTKERNERMALFNSMSEGVLLFDFEGCLIRSNKAAAELLGFDNEKPYQLNRCHIPHLMEEGFHTLKSGESFEKEFCFQKDLQDVFLFVRGSVLHNEGEKYLLLTVTDLTNLRKLEAFRSDFIANVSHEIKTPLTCITQAAEALNETTVSENREKLVTILKKNTERFNNLVKDLLSLAQLEKPDAVKREMGKISLDIILDNVISIEQQRIAECGFELQTLDMLPLTVCADADLLEQAIINLIENALRYSNGKTITLSITQEGTNAVVMVKDDGIGIPEEHLERIFERFYRVDKSRSRELGGTGLGLAIVKHIAIVHRGKAEVSSQLGVGAEFRIIIPLG